MLGLTKKSKLEDVQTELEHVRGKLDRTRDDMNEMEESYQKILETGSFDPLPDKRCDVITLEEPRLAWKRTENYIAELVIVPGTDVVYPDFPNGKIRVGEAYVRRFLSPEYEELNVESDSAFHENFTYEQGEFEVPDMLEENIYRECTNGIHVFNNKEAAEDYSSWMMTDFE